MQPTVGRIVRVDLLVGDVPVGRPAIVVEAEGEVATLAVFTPDGTEYRDLVPYSETPELGHWSWPPRA